MFCKNCGFNLEEEKDFCPRCGVKLEEQVEQLLAFPREGRQFRKQLLGEREIVVKGDSTKVIAGMLGVFALLSVAVGTSFLLMSMIMSSESKKSIKIGKNYFEEEDSEEVKEHYKKVIDLEVNNDSTYVDMSQ